MVVPWLPLCAPMNAAVFKILEVPKDIIILKIMITAGVRRLKKLEEMGDLN